MSTTSWLREEVKMSTSPCSCTDTRRRATLHQRASEIQPESKNLIFYIINYLVASLWLRSIRNAQRCSMKRVAEFIAKIHNHINCVSLQTEHQSFRILFQLQERSTVKCSFFFKKVNFSIYLFSRVILGKIFFAYSWMNNIPFHPLWTSFTYETIWGHLCHKSSSLGVGRGANNPSP
jgi:hypothetical protein